MAEYLKQIMQLSEQFTLIGRPQSITKINHCIFSSLREEWEPLILYLAPTLPNMTIDNLSTTLLQQEARRNFHHARGSPVLGARLLGQPLSINLSRDSFGGHGFSGHDGRPHGRVAG